MIHQIYQIKDILRLHAFFGSWVSFYTPCIPFSINTLFFTYPKKKNQIKDIKTRHLGQNIAFASPWQYFPQR